MKDTSAPQEPSAKPDSVPSGESGTLTRIFRNAGYLLCGKGMAGILGFAGTALAVRALGLQGYGALLLIHACAGSFSAVTRFQSWQPLLHFGNALFARQERETFQRLLRHTFMLDMTGAVTGLVLALAGVASFGPTLGWPPELQGAALLYMTSILFMNTCCAMGVLRLTDRFRQSAMADVAISAVRLTGAISGIWLHWGVGAFLMVWYLSTVTAFVSNTGLAWRAIRGAPSLAGFRVLGVRWICPIDGIWRLSFAGSGNQALSTMSTRVGVLILGAAIGPAGAAIYNVAWQMCDALAQPAQLLTPALYPELIRLRDRRDWKALRSVTRRIFQALGGFSVLAMLGAGIAGPWLIHVLLSVQGPGTRWLLLLLTTAALLDLWDVPLEPLLFSLGQGGRLFIGRFTITVLSLPILYGLAVLWGVLGAGLATLLAEGAILATRIIPYLLLKQR